MKHKLIMESWRRYLDEEVTLLNEEELLAEMEVVEGLILEGELLEEGAIDKIKGLFAKAPDVGSYDPDNPPDGGWPQNSYGAFAAANGVLGALKDAGAKSTAGNIAQGFMAMTGMSTGGEKSTLAKVAGPVAAVGLAIAGVYGSVAVGTALGVAGIATAAIGLVQTLKGDPSKADKYPILKLFQIDAKYRDLLDDDLEDKIEEEFKKFFIGKLKRSPERTMVSINKFLEAWLKDNVGNRTVTGSPDLTRGN